MAAGLLLGLFALQGAILVRRTGVTYDEPPHIAAGFVYWSAGLGLMTREQPPLTDYLRGLALLPLGPALPGPIPGRERVPVSPHEYGQLFLFRNRVPPVELLRAARWVTFAAAVLLGAFLFGWSAAVGGPAAGLAALFIFAFEPNLLAHGTLANTDFMNAAFMAASLAGWAAYLRGKGNWPLGLAGAAAGAAICSKATGLGLLPAMALSLAALRLHDRKRSWKEDLTGLAAAAAIAAFVVLLVYKPPELHRFYEMVAYRSRQMSSPTPILLFGRNYPQGSALYFPAVLVLKTTIPLLLLGLHALSSRRLWRAHPAEWAAAASAMAFVLAAAMAGRRHLGVRYLLAFYPLLCLLAGVDAADIWKTRPKARVLLMGAAAWHAVSSLAVFPFPLGYLNESAGGAGNGYRVLGDSIQDWGRAVPELVRFMERNPGGLILSYFGTDCPREQGLAFQEAFSTPGVCPGAGALLPADIGREWLAVSETKWQGFFEGGPPAWGWLRSRRPVANLGYAMLVYDVSGDSDAHLRMAEMYDRAGQPASARRERERAEFILRR